MMIALSPEHLGYLAACCTTLAFLPQALQTIRTKNTQSLSLGMYFLFTCGVLMWLFYGAFKKDAPLITANAVTAVLAAVILYHKIRNDVFKK